MKIALLIILFSSLPSNFCLDFYFNQNFSGITPNGSFDSPYNNLQFLSEFQGSFLSVSLILLSNLTLSSQIYLYRMSLDFKTVVDGYYSVQVDGFIGFQLENSSLGFANISFNGVPTNSLVSGMNGSTLTLNNINFVGLSLLTTTLFNLSDSSFFIFQSEFSKISFQKQGLLVFNAATSGINSLIISRSIFEGLIQLLEDPNQDNIFEINAPESNISLDNCIFKGNSIAKTLFSISNNFGVLSITASVFTNNKVKWQIIDSNGLSSLLIENSICQMNNDPDSLQPHNNYLGGCFRSLNDLQRKFSNVTIMGCYSDFTAVGIKIIDTTSIATNIINLTNCNFLNNFVNFQQTENETGVALYISSPSFIFLSNSAFLNNSITNLASSSFFASTPCLISSSPQNNLQITSSSFLENHSRYKSNCISFSGNSLSINSSVFINNTSPGASIKTCVELDYGGCIDFRGINISSSNCLFKNNSGYMGGVFYVLGNGQSKIDFSVQSSVFIGNIAYLGGGIGFSSGILAIDAVVNNCSFMQNYGSMGGGIHVDSFTGHNCFNITGNYFTGNMALMGGVLNINIYNGPTCFYLQNNTYDTNIGYDFANHVGAGAVIKLLMVGAYVGPVVSEFEQYLNNIAELRDNSGHDGGCYYCLQGSVVNFIGCTFLMVHSDFMGGSLVLTDNARGYISNSNFTNSKTQELGGFLMVSEKSTIQVTGTSFFGGFARFGGIACFVENYALLSSFVDCQFSSNNALNTLFDLTNAEISISGSTFMNNANILVSLMGSNLLFKDSYILKQVCSTNNVGCLLVATEASTALITGVFVEELNSLVGEGSIYTENANISLYNSSFKALRNAKFIGACLSLYSSNLTISKSTFEDYDSNCIFSMNECEVSIDSSSFSQKNYTAGNEIRGYGTVYCQDCLVFNVTSTVFEYNVGVSTGAAIFLQSDNLISFSLSQQSQINNCTFAFNQASLQGGALYISDQNINISDCIFTNNSASEGGAIFLDNSDDLIVQTEIVNNIFTFNTAKTEGGAINWAKDQPEISQTNIFNQNSAKYGADVAAYPIRLEIDIYDSNEFIGLDSNQTVLNDGKDNQTILLANVSSGNDFPYVIVSKIVDVYGNLVKLDNGVVQLQFFTDRSNNNSSESGLQLIIEGDSAVPAIEGVGVMENLKMNYKPNSNITVKLTASNILQYYSQFLEGNQYIYELNENQNYGYLINLSFRPCVPGEIYRPQAQICQQCPVGSYSLIDGMFAESCISCPDNSLSCYLNIILVRPGYWKATNLSEIIYFCQEFSDRCLGGAEPVSCENGYTGPLCSCCIKGYSRQGLNTCAQCSSKAINMLSLVGVLFAFCMLLFVMTIVSVKQSEKLIRTQSPEITNPSPKNSKGSPRHSIKQEKKNKSLSIYLKILLNYLQMLSIMQGFQLQWPFYVRNYLNFFSTVGGGISAQAISVDCLINDYQIDVASLYLQTLFMAIFPFVVYLLTIIVLFTIFFVSKKSQNVRFVVVVIVVSIFLQPSILKILFDNLQCETIEKNSFLIQDMNISCDSGSYKTWIVVFVVPFILFWAFIYPFICIVYLFKNRKDLHKISVKARVNFYINGYKNRFYYWEFVIMYRKIFFISVNFLQGLQIFAKAAILLLLSAFSVFLTSIHKPFIYQELNNIELYSNISILITVFSGALYVQEEISDYLKAVLFVFILFVNIWFGIYWVLSCFELFLYRHFNFIFKYFPKLTKNFVALQEALQKTPLQTNLFKYTRNVITSARILANGFTDRMSVSEVRDSGKVKKMKKSIVKLIQ